LINNNFLYLEELLDLNELNSKRNIRNKPNLQIDVNNTFSPIPIISPHCNKIFHSYFSTDSNNPLISPINYYPQMFPVSTKNQFNINIDNLLIQNLIETPINRGGNIQHTRIPSSDEAKILGQSKEVNLQDKILINDSENIYQKNLNCVANNLINEHNDKEIDIKNDIKNRNKIISLEQKKNLASNPYFEIIDENSINKSCNNFKNLSSSKRFLFDIVNINQPHSKNFLSESSQNRNIDKIQKIPIDKNQINSIIKNQEKKSFNSLPLEIERSQKFQDLNFYKHSELKKDGLEVASQENKKIIFSTFNTKQANNNNLKKNINLQYENNSQDHFIGNFQTNECDEIDSNKKRNIDAKIDINENTTCYSKDNSPEANQNLKMEFLNNCLNRVKPMFSPLRANLNVSPKSAFVFNKKLFN